MLAADEWLFINHQRNRKFFELAAGLILFAVDAGIGCVIDGACRSDPDEV